TLLEEAEAVDAVAGVPAGGGVADGPQGERGGVEQPQPAVEAGGGEDRTVGRERDGPHALLVRQGVHDLPRPAVPDPHLAPGRRVAVGGGEGLAVRAEG